MFNTLGNVEQEQFNLGEPYEQELDNEIAWNDGYLIGFALGILMTMWSKWYVKNF